MPKASRGRKPGKDKIGRVLSDIGYYYAFTTADPGVEPIH